MSNESPTDYAQAKIEMGRVKYIVYLRLFWVFLGTFQILSRFSHTRAVFCTFVVEKSSDMDQDPQEALNITWLVRINESVWYLFSRPVDDVDETCGPLTSGNFSTEKVVQALIHGRAFCLAWTQWRNHCEIFSMQGLLMALIRQRCTMVSSSSSIKRDHAPAYEDL